MPRSHRALDWGIFNDYLKVGGAMAIFAATQVAMFFFGLDQAFHRAMNSNVLWLVGLAAVLGVIGWAGSRIHIDAPSPLLQIAGLVVLAFALAPGPAALAGLGGAGQSLYWTVATFAGTFLVAVCYAASIDASRIPGTVMSLLGGIGVALIAAGFFLPGDTDIIMGWGILFVFDSMFFSVVLAISNRFFKLLWHPNALLAGVFAISLAWMFLGR